MNQEIAQYEEQLSQVKLAIASLPNGVEKQNLCALEADLLELIQLSKKNLINCLDESESKSDPLSKQYKLFKKELAEIDKGKNDNFEIFKKFNFNRNQKLEDNEFIKELNALQGARCQAPYLYKWANDVTYHNAIISHIPNIDEVKEYAEIEVKVMFTNPTHKEMLPCPYYLKGNCKFDDKKCRFSHGELVLLSTLKDYKEPVFSTLSAGSQVFAKQNDELWHRAIVVQVNEADCCVKFESNFKEEFIAFHNIYPLETTLRDEEGFEEDNDSCSDLGSDNDSGTLLNDNKNNSNIIRRILDNPAESRLGDWEKFTKGFGSRIMAKMGYVHGSGLGKNGEGRIEPVSAVILPPGKSLDHCMSLKSQDKNKDFLKAKKKVNKLKKRHEEKLKLSYIREKNRTNIFSFLNEHLHQKTNEKQQNMEIKKELKNESIRDLNVTSLKLFEEMKKTEKEIKTLNQSLTRHSPNTSAFNVIKG